jgi:hypothetical protein
MKTAALLCLCLLLCSCMPAFQVNQVPMTIQGKQVVYVAASWHNGQGVNACAIDRYVEGNLVAHDLLTNAGIAELLFPALVNAAAPFATAVGPYVTGAK